MQVRIMQRQPLFEACLLDICSCAKAGSRVLTPEAATPAQCVHPIFMHCMLLPTGKELVRRLEYVTPVKKNKLGPKEAWCIEKEVCTTRGLAGFVVLEEAYTPRVCPLHFNCMLSASACTGMSVAAHALLLAQPTLPVLSVAVLNPAQCVLQLIQVCVLSTAQKFVAADCKDAHELHR